MYLVAAQHAAPLHESYRPLPSSTISPAFSVRFHFLRERTRHHTRYGLGRRRRRLEPFRRLDLDVVIPIDAGPRRVDMADDDVLLEPPQVVPRAAHSRVGHHPGALRDARRTA